MGSIQVPGVPVERVESIWAMRVDGGMESSVELSKGFSFAIPHSRLLPARLAIGTPLSSCSFKHS